MDNSCLAFIVFCSPDLPCWGMFANSTITGAARWHIIQKMGSWPTSLSARGHCWKLAKQWAFQSLTKLQRTLTQPAAHSWNLPAVPCQMTRWWNVRTLRRCQLPQDVAQDNRKGCNERLEGSAMPPWRSNLTGYVKLKQSWNNCWRTRVCSNRMGWIIIPKQCFTFCGLWPPDLTTKSSKDRSIFEITLIQLTIAGRCPWRWCSVPLGSSRRSLAASSSGAWGRARPSTFGTEGCHRMPVAEPNPPCADCGFAEPWSPRQEHLEVFGKQLDLYPGIAGSSWSWCISIDFVCSALASASLADQRGGWREGRAKWRDIWFPPKASTAISCR